MDLQSNYDVFYNQFSQKTYGCYVKIFMGLLDELWCLFVSNLDKFIWFCEFLLFSFNSYSLQD